MLWLWFASTVICVALHAIVAQTTSLGFAEAFRIARSGAAAALTGLGFYALIHWSPYVTTSYVLEAPDSFATALMGIPLGHFAADFLLMAYGWVTERSKPRKDLVVHHLAALGAAALTLRWSIAVPYYLILLTTEMMPVTTGLSGIGSWLQRRDVILAADRARLGVLIGWRVPFWACVLTGAVLGLWREAAHPDAPWVYLWAAIFTMVTLSLDAYWIRKSWLALRRHAREADAIAEV